MTRTSNNASTCGCQTPLIPRSSPSPGSLEVAVASFTIGSFIIFLNQLFNSLSCAHRAILHSEFFPHTAPWLAVTPPVSLGLHFDNDELHTAIKWWLGITPGMSDTKLPLCLEKIQDPFCHHSTQWPI